MLSYAMIFYLLLIKTHLSQCSEWMVWIWVTYGGHWRCTSGSHWTGGKASLWASEEWTTTMIGGVPVGTTPSLSPASRRCAREMPCCVPGHRAMPLTAMPGGMGRWGVSVCGRGPGPLREAVVWVCTITGHNCIRNNHTTDAQATRTHTNQQWSLEQSPPWKWCSQYRQLVPMTHTHTDMHTGLCENKHLEISFKGREAVASSSYHTEYKTIFSSGHFCVSVIIIDDVLT